MTPILITSLDNHPIILGKPWINAYYIIINIIEDRVTFREKDCYIIDALARKLANLAIRLRLRPLLHAPLSYLGNSLR